MRLHWLTNAPWVVTAYGKGAALFIPRFAALGHEQSITAYYGHEGAPMTYGGVLVYGRGADVYRRDIVAAEAHNCGAD